MKISVILGVIQMSFGIFMKALNALYFGRKVEFFFEFIPQITMLLALFGFMDLMIIQKWLTDYSLLVGAKPPSVITNLINMYLNLGYPTDSSTPLWDN
jgi:V-type H+-transporting ATPase subunit a